MIYAYTARWERCPEHQIILLDTNFAILATRLLLKYSE